MNDPVVMDVCMINHADDKGFRIFRDTLKINFRITPPTRFHAISGEIGGEFGNMLADGFVLAAGQKRIKTEFTSRWTGLN